MYVCVCVILYQVVLTEKERRDSEIEHRKVLNDCTTIMMQYQTTERKLHSHIVKSRQVRLINVYMQFASWVVVDM